MGFISLKHILICVIISFELSQQTSTVQNDDIFEAKVALGSCDNVASSLIESFRSIMPTGSEKLGMPKLSPYEVEYIGVDVSHEVGNATGFFKNFKVEQLHTFETTNVNCKLGYKKFSLEINATVPTVNITGDYDLDGFIIEMIPMYGDGPFSINITNLHIGILANGTYGISLDKIKVQDLSLWVTMDETQMWFDNILNGHEEFQPLFNKMFSEIGPQAVIDLWPDIEPILVRKLLKVINSESDTISTF